ncbi:not available [Salmonella enterica subsp. enterica serovar Typhimurium]|nr:not available [Salmonella enterica subsp. enterica serovar Typhimurium]
MITRLITKFITLMVPAAAKNGVVVQVVDKRI